MKILEDFLKIIKKVGDYEDIYSELIEIDDKKITHTGRNKTHTFTKDERRVIKEMSYVPIEQLNVFINEIRKKEEFINMAESRAKRKILTQMKKEQFDKEYEEYLRSCEINEDID